MEEIDIWRAAAAAVSLYGEGAAIKAGLRADTLLDSGDADGFHIWSRIAKAITALERIKAKRGQLLN